MEKFKELKHHLNEAKQKGFARLRSTNRLFESVKQ